MNYGTFYIIGLVVLCLWCLAGTADCIQRHRRRQYEIGSPTTNENEPEDDTEQQVLSYKRAMEDTADILVV